jgi:Stress responsive A/B Barrel Domain
MVTHIVLFKFANQNDAEASRDKLLGMKGQVPSLLDIEAGVDFTRSDRSYELGLITRHESKADLEAYRVDPVHLEVAGFLKERHSGAVAVDFETI